MSNTPSTPPADQRRPLYVTSRLRYFDGEFLATADFVDEQNYHVDRQTRHETHLHAPGVLEGLAVRIDGSGASPLSVVVAPGSALDAMGNQVLLAEATTVTLEADAANGDYLVFVSFVETPSDPQEGSGGETRFTQAPAKTIGIGSEVPEGALPLARVRVTGGSIDAVDMDCVRVDGRTRRYAGAHLPGPPGEAATLRVENVVAAQTADAYPEDGGYVPPDYRVLLTARGGFEVDAEADSPLLEVTGEGVAASVPMEARDGLVVTGTGAVTDLFNAQAMMAVGTAQSPTYHFEVWNNADPGASAPLFCVMDETKGVQVYSKATIGANGRMSIGKSYSNGSPDDNLEVWDGNARLLGVTSESAALDAGVVLHANGGVTVADTKIYDSGVMSIGHASSDRTHPLEVWSGDAKLFVVTPGAVNVSESIPLKPGGGLVVADTRIDGSGTVSIGHAPDNVSHPLEVWDGATKLLAVTADGVNVCSNKPFSANGGISVSDTCFDGTGTLSIGHAPDNVSHPLEVWDGATKLLAVTADGVNVCSNKPFSANGGISVSDTCFDGTGTLSIGHAPDDVTHPLEVWGGGTKLFAVSTSSVAVGATARLNANGGLAVSDTRIDTSGTLSIGHAPDDSSHPLEVWSGGTRLFTVTGNAVNVAGAAHMNANGGLTVGDGMTLNGNSSLLGQRQDLEFGTEYSAASDGFVVAWLDCHIDKRQENIVGEVGGETRAAASSHRDAGGSNKTLVDYCSITMPVRKGETWKVSHTQDSDLPGDTSGSNQRRLYFMPIGN
ncbi:hypothetical protein FKV24_000445 [Lysobacter maris]|uniref:Uncharacterized protein n=1 Tax=Marilutibacter maris TaxID=1605891 RepID=A0A508B5G2_9GAMM|nr:hypothetical protein [Lysobacter maris]KAB8198675.1 hypothetical protein FKV24_000445 [Lysobacter maris]